MEQICEAFDKIVQLGLKLGVSNLKDYPGAWVHKVDECWTVAVNGLDDPVRAKPQGCMSVSIDPFNAAVWFNGWLAGSLDPYGGILAAGEGANEDTFIEAVDEAIRKIASPV